MSRLAFLRGWRPPPLRERLGFFLSADNRVTRLAVAVDGNPYDTRALTLIGSLGGRAQTILAGGPLAGAQIAVGGPAAFFVDIRDVASDDFWVLAVLVLAAVFGILAVLLRSLLAPVCLLASVVLSYLATLGLTVLIFQGVGEGPATADRPIAVPVSGRWRYRVDGTRRIGLAGSDQPFAEDVDTSVPKVGGDEDSPAIKLVTDCRLDTGRSNVGTGPARWRLRPRKRPRPGSGSEGGSTLHNSCPVGQRPSGRSGPVSGRAAGRAVARVRG